MRGSFIGLLIGCFSGAATGVFIQIMTRMISNSMPGFMAHILGLDSSFSPVIEGMVGILAGVFTFFLIVIDEMDIELHLSQML